MERFEGYNQAPVSVSNPPTLPLVILGGRDRHTSNRLPEGGGDQQLLHGYKTLDVRIGDRPLIEVHLERLRATGAFDPIFLVGPAALYRPLDLGIELIDSDGAFGDNLRASVNGATVDRPRGHLAVIAGDILPEAEELDRALTDLASHFPCDYWMPQVPVPDDLRQLGESAWKPKYRIRPSHSDGTVGEALAVLPGHLLVADLRGVRLELMYRMLELFYRTRNQPIWRRRRTTVTGLLSTMLWYDLRNLVHLRAPTTTFSMLYHGLSLAAKLKSGLVQREAEDRIRQIFFTRYHRRRFPDHRGRIALLDLLSLAKDIDTVEEAREVVARLIGKAPPATPEPPDNGAA